MGRRPKQSPAPNLLDPIMLLLIIQRWRPEDGSQPDRIIAAVRDLMALTEAEQKVVLDNVRIDHQITLPELLSAASELEAEVRSWEPPKRSWWGILCTDGTIEVFPYDEKAGLKQVDASRERTDIAEWYGPFRSGLNERDAIMWIAMEIVNASVEKGLKAGAPGAGETLAQG